MTDKLPAASAKKRPSPPPTVRPSLLSRLVAWLLRPFARPRRKKKGNPNIYPLH